MRILRDTAGYVFFCMLVYTAGCGSPYVSATCDRDCLENFIDQYLEAVIARDSSRLELADAVKFTENGQRLEVGDGLWNTANARGSYQIYIADPPVGQAGFIGTIRENDTPAILALRLKVDDLKITEIETFVVRDDSGALLLEELGEPHPAFLETVPTSEQISREELIEVANMYFVGLERNNGRGVYPFTDDCHRIENGTPTTNKPSAWPAPDPSDSSRVGPMVDVYSLGCKDQFETGFDRFVTRIRDRRFVVVDQERSLVFAFAFFDHAGDVHSVTMSNGVTIPIGVTRPWTWEIAELFKIEDGLLDQIEALYQEAPYGMNSGWSGWEEGLSSRARY